MKEDKNSFKGKECCGPRLTAAIPNLVNEFCNLLQNDYQDRNTDMISQEASVMFEEYKVKTPYNIETAFHNPIKNWQRVSATQAVYYTIISEKNVMYAYFFNFLEDDGDPVTAFDEIVEINLNSMA